MSVNNNNKKPLVTIVTAVYNLIKSGRKEFFEQCLKSVHEQSYKNIEHIIIDGDSNDGTLDLIKKYSEKGWIKYISEKDNGIYDAMNKGIKKSKGKYIAFLGSDDYYHDKDGIKKVVEALEENNADFSYAPIRLVNDKDKEVQKNHPSRKPDISRAYLKMPLCHQTMFTKREIMIKEKMFDAKFKIAADYDFLVKICLKGCKSVLVNCEFATYRVGGESGQMAVKNHEEVEQIYLKEFGSLYPVTKEMCHNILKNEYEAIPVELAKSLNKHPKYFNFKEYLKYYKTDKFTGDYSDISHIKLHKKEKIISKEKYQNDIKNIFHYNQKAINPKVSVIIVAYNEGNDLIRNIDHFQNQTVNDFELIIVDNGLSDQIKEKLKKYSLTHIDLKNNVGPSAGRNIGALYAETPLLAFIDADGYVNEYYIEATINIFKEDTSKVAVRGKVLTIEQSVDMPPMWYDLGNESFSILPITEGNTVMRKKEYIKVGGQEDCLYGHEGAVLFYRMIKFYGYNIESFYYDPRLVLYHDINKKGNLNKKKNDRYRKLEEIIFSFYPDLKDYFYKYLGFKNSRKAKDEVIDCKNREIKQKNLIIFNLQNAQNIRNSKSFKLGDLFFRSIKKPYKLITFPINFLIIVLGIDKKVKLNSVSDIPRLIGKIFVKLKKKFFPRPIIKR